MRNSFWTTSLCVCGQYQDFLSLATVDDVADQIDRGGIVVAQEIQQEFGLAAARAEMHVRNPDRAIMAHLRALAHFVPPGLGAASQ